MKRIFILAVTMAMVLAQASRRATVAAALLASMLAWPVVATAEKQAI